MSIPYLHIDKQDFLDTHLNLKKKIFQVYCIFRLIFSVFILIIIIRHPENLPIYLPAFLFSSILPVIALLAARKFFYPTVIALMAINFFLTTFYAVTTEASNPNSLAATLLITYLAQIMLIGFIFRWTFSFIYGCIAYVLVLLKQAGVFLPFTLHNVNGLHRIEFILFTGGYFIIIIGFVSSNARLVKMMVKNLVSQSHSLVEAEAKYRSIFENAQDGIFQSTQDGRIIMANTSLAKILGFESPEVLMQSINDVGNQIFMNPHERIKIIDLLKSHDQITEFEVQIKRKDKQFVWVLADINGIKDEHGNLLYLEGLVRDITDKKNAEIILQKREEFIRKMTQNTSEAIVACDEHGILSFYNNSALEWYGLDLLDTEHETWANVYGLYDPVTNQQLKKNENPLFRAFNNETVKNVEIVINTKDQTSRHVLCNGDPIIDDNGKKIGAVVVMSDITERKQNENQLINQFEELKKTNHELDKFVYSVSHDLRAPITSVLGLINLALKESPTTIQKNYLEMIDSSIQRMDRFIKEILDYSQNSRTALQQDQIGFEEIINEIKQDLQYLDGFEKTKISLRLNTSFEFYSDKHRIKILLINLFSNAIKFADRMKEQSIIEIAVDITPQTAEIKFHDNGIGIESSQLTKIFDMFYRATDRAKGSGLGLYITKEIVTKLKGSIAVEAEVGQYTTFTVLIPNNTKHS
jgi:PAS domain S-box-containing protein